MGRGRVGWVGRKIGAGKCRGGVWGRLYISYIVGAGFWEGVR